MAQRDEAAAEDAAQTCRQGLGAVTESELY